MSVGAPQRSPTGGSTYYLNVRLTDAEKELLDEALELAGYVGRGAISDFVRDQVLAAAHAVVETARHFEENEND